MERDTARAAVLAALNGDGDRYIVDHNGDVFDSELGEFGGVIVTRLQLDRLIDLVNAKLQGGS